MSKIKKWKVILQENREYEVEAKIQPEAVMRCVRGYVEGTVVPNTWKLINSKEIK